MIKDAVAGVPLGSTSDGANWCMKALNPAAPEPVVGLPDQENAARVCKHYERTVTIAAPAAAAWACDILLHANPWIPSAYLTNDGVVTACVPVMNTQLGATSALIREFLHANTEAYRIIYGSMTVVLDATTLTNSGLAAASQYIYVPKKITIDTNAVNPLLRMSYHAWPDDIKSYDTLVQVPGTYTGVARDGAYLPLRLNPEEPWVRTQDYVGHLNYQDTVVVGANAYNWASGALPAASPATYFPFGMLSTTTGATVFEDPNQQSMVGHIAFRNLNPAATLRVTYRLGVEFLVTPGTVFASDIHLPPVYDPTAMDLYKKASMKLKLAYPAEYNDWQLIVKTIADVARTLLPMVPVVGPALAGAVTPLERVIQRRLDRRTQRAFPVSQNPVQAPTVTVGVAGASRGLSKRARKKRARKAIMKTNPMRPNGRGPDVGGGAAKYIINKYLR